MALLDCRKSTPSRGTPSCLLMRIIAYVSRQRETLSLSVKNYNDRIGIFVMFASLLIWRLLFPVRGKYLMLDLRSNIHLMDTLSLVDDAKVTVLDDNLY